MRDIRNGCFFCLHPCAFRLSEWGRVDTKVERIYTSYAFDKLHYQKHK
jgi:hypothetical protein